jgi:hypothetical protein
MPPLSYQDLAKHPDTFLAFTGLTVPEFRQILVYFGNSWTKSHPLDQLGRGRPPIINSMQDRLLFILHYYKCYPIQEVIGYLFGISQERANVCIKECTDVLLVALRESGFAPERVPEALKKNLMKLQKRISSSTEQSVLSNDQKTVSD